MALLPRRAVAGPYRALQPPRCEGRAFGGAGLVWVGRIRSLSTEVARDGRALGERHTQIKPRRTSTRTQAGFWWALVGFGGLWWALVGSIGFYRVLSGFVGFYRVLSGFIGFCRVLVGFVWFYAAIFFCEFHTGGWGGEV